MSENKKTTRLRLHPDEADIIKRYRRIKQEAEEMGLHSEDIKHGWIKNKEASLFFKNPGFDDGTLTEEDISKVFDALLKKHKDRVYKEFKSQEVIEKRAIKVTRTDAHVGLNPNPDGDTLFQYEYNAKVYKRSIDKVFKSIMKEYADNGTFDRLFMDNLGDGQDGWDGKTVRGGHDLPQNMTNGEVFNLCVDTEVELIRKLAENKVANKIVLRIVVNDNHSGSFGLIIALAIQKIINLLYDRNYVEVDILKRFIEHRVYGDHCFLLTHGKDKVAMKTGFPIRLDDKTIKKIYDYINHYNVDSKYIHVEKGDLHQIAYSKTNKFDYRNFMSFSPPSRWIQHNFGDSYSGYSIQIVPKYGNEIQHTDYFLDYTKIT